MSSAWKVYDCSSGQNYTHHYAAICGAESIQHACFKTCCLGGTLHYPGVGKTWHPTGHLGAAGIAKIMSTQLALPVLSTCCRCRLALLTQTLELRCQNGTLKSLKASLTELLHNQTADCRFAETSMGNFMTCSSCSPRGVRFQRLTTSSWATLWTVATTA